MYFVYMLSYNGIPFYIGMTNSIVKRYIAHYSGQSLSTATGYCHYLLEQYNAHADISIIGVCKNRTDAESLEVWHINKCAVSNILLTNRINNGKAIRLIDTSNKPEGYRFPKQLKLKLTNLENNYRLIYEQ